MSVIDKFKTLIGGIQQSTSDFVEKNKDSSFIKFLDSSHKSLQAAIATLDKILKSKGVDVESTFNQGKEKTKYGVEVGKAIVTESKEAFLASNLGKKTTETVSGVTDYLGKLFSKQGAPPEDKEDTNVAKEDTNVAKEDTNVAKEDTNVAKEDTNVAKEGTAPTSEQPSDKETSIPLLSDIRNILIKILQGDRELNPNELSGSTSFKNKIKSLFTRKKTEDKKEEAKADSVEETPSLLSRIFNRNKAKQDTDETIAQKNKRMSKRQKEIEAEKQSVRDRAKAEQEEGKGSWLKNLMMKIFGVIAPLGGALLGGIKTIATSLGSFLLGGLGKLLLGIPAALGKILATVLPGAIKGIGAAATGIAAGAKALGGAAIKGAGALIGGAAKAVGGAAVSIAGSTAAKVGGAILAKTPIGLGVLAVGGLIYGGMLIHRHLNRNNTGSGIPGLLTRHRLKLYGFDETKRSHFSRVFELEMFLKERITFATGRVKLKTFDTAEKAQLLEIFNIATTDQHYTRKLEILTAWFNNRFLPVFFTYTQALKNINSTLYFDNLDRLRPLEFERLIAGITVMPTRIYQVTQVPLFGSHAETNIVITKEQIDQFFASVRIEMQRQIPKDNRQQTNTSAAATATMAATAAATATAPSNVPQTQTRPPTPPAIQNRAIPPIVDDDHETEPPVTNAAPATASPPPVNAASGALKRGDNSLTGIRLNGRLTPDKIHNLHPNVRELFTGMAKEYNAITGKSIATNQAFRSFEEQAALHRRMPDRAARPGRSMHEFGLAIDINTPDANQLDKLGLLRKYGFTRPIGGETWHIEPMGISLDPERSRNDPVFRRNAILSSPGTGGGGYGTVSGSRMKRRNIPHQLAIFSNNNTRTVNVEKIQQQTAANVRGNVPPTLTTPTATNTSNRTIPTATNTSNRTIPTATNTSNRTIPTTVTSAGAVGAIATATTSAAGTIATQVTRPTQPRILEETRSGTPIVEDDHESEPPRPTTPNDQNTPVRNIAGNTNIDLGRYANLTPEQAIDTASRLTGVDKHLLFTFAQLESSFRPNAQARTSSASGMFQVTEGTWRYMLNKVGRKYNIPPDADQSNVLYSAIIAAEYVKQNLNGLRGIYKQANIEQPVAAYLAHHFGPTGSRRLINAYIQNPNTPIRDVVTPAAYRANSAILQGRTVQEYMGIVEGRFNTAATHVAGRFNLNTSAPRTAMASAGATTATFAGATPPANRPPGLITARDTSTTNAIPVAATASTPTITQPPIRMVTGSSNLFTENTSTSIVPRNTQTPTPAGSTITQPSPVIDLSSTEAILTNQLNTLVNIASILGSINDKFDTNKPPINQPNRGNNIHNVSNTGIDLKRNIHANQT